ncbi:MAG: MoxR family ATPase, partial [Planctomycetota bacterium]
HPLPSPFFVLATQNPIEQEGTYPLPEAQLDRFMMQINVGYMNQADETRVVLQTTEEHEETIDPILTAETLLAISGAVRRVALAPNVAEYATRIVRATRPPQPSASTPLTSDQSSAETPSPEIVQKYVQWGSGPRGAQSLVLAAKANAAMDGRAMVQRNDIDTMLLPVLRHRVRMGFSARADGVSVDQLLMEVLRTVQQEEKEQHEQSSKASGMGDVVRPTNPA